MSCRLCGAASPDAGLKASSVSLWKELISLVLPEQIVQDSDVVCRSCVRNLHKFVALKKSYMETEEKIISYRSGNAPNSRVDLRDVFTFSRKEQFLPPEPGSLFCRVCLRETTAKESFTLTCNSNDAIHIRNLLPEMDLEATTSPIICKRCSETAEELYLFQQKYINAQFAPKTTIDRGQFASNKNIEAILSYYAISESEEDDDRTAPGPGEGHRSENGGSLSRFDDRSN